MVRKLKVMNRWCWICLVSCSECDMDCLESYKSIYCEMPDEE